MPNFAQLHLFLRGNVTQWEIRRDLVLVPPTMYNATTHILI